MKKTFTKFLVIGSSAVVFGLGLMAANTVSQSVGHPTQHEIFTLSSVSSHTSSGYDAVKEHSFTENLGIAGKVASMALKGLGANLQDSGDNLSQYVDSKNGKGEAVKLSNSVGKIDISENFADKVKEDRAKRIEEEKKNRKPVTVSLAAMEATSGALGQVIKPHDMAELKKLQTRVEHDAKILNQNKTVNKNTSVQNMEAMRKAALNDLSVEANPGAYVVSKP